MGPLRGSTVRTAPRAAGKVGRKPSKNWAFLQHFSNKLQDSNLVCDIFCNWGADFWFLSSQAEYDSKTWNSWFGWHKKDRDGWEKWDKTGSEHVDEEDEAWVVCIRQRWGIDLRIFVVKNNTEVSLWPEIPWVFRFFFFLKRQLFVWLRTFTGFGFTSMIWMEQARFQWVSRCCNRTKKDTYLIVVNLF